jgi:hypothetical protein
MQFHLSNQTLLEIFHCRVMGHVCRCGMANTPLRPCICIYDELDFTRPCQDFYSSSESANISTALGLLFRASAARCPASSPALSVTDCCC